VNWWFIRAWALLLAADLAVWALVIWAIWRIVR